ncbi:SUMF1/EgtB/PvdO family nonheme iron enzyme [Desulfopila sp. IMCC35008]|uniref:SUMF1/EgtB/PvdO family nonheme iron enzyme n=1 Tax=Desulfopila sp. IMCC35008 TaxID=2653858 RepID=UPI0013CFD9E6|nr:SUMF1/EgtB/PvdO family nonheme iron enzyme [Desulfopila sp. IMCC35008]
MTKYISVQGSGHQTEYTENNLPLTVGERGQCDIGLASCSGTIGLIGAEGGHLFFQPVDSGQTLFFNSRQMTSSAWLKSGDKIEVGNSVVLFSVAGDCYTFSISSKEEIDRERDAGFYHPAGPLYNKSNESLPLEILPAAQNRSGNTFLYLSLFALGALLLGSIFLFLAKPVSFQVSPEPDRIRLTGFPPALSVGARYLAWSSRYTLIAEKTGYARLEEIIEVKDTDNRFSFKLEKLPGQLHLILTPAQGVAVWVDDIQVGSTEGGTNTDVFDIAPGRHLLRLEKPRYHPLEERIDIEGESRLQVFRAALKPAWSSLLLESEPEGAVIEVDGKRQGTTPASLELLQGNHKIVVSKNGFLEESLEIETIAGQDEKSRVTLTPTPAAVTVTSVPEGTTVLVDGEFLGITPMDMQLPSGKELDFSLQLPGFESQAKHFIFQAGEEKSLHFTMKQEYGVVFFQVDPPAAELFIDGKKQPDSNGRMLLPVKTLQVAAHHPQFGRYTSTVTPKKAYAQQVHINLASREGAGNAPLSSQEEKRGGNGHSLRLIRPVEFMMGAPRREAGRRANEQERKVALDKAFYVSPRLVTNGDYRKFNPKHSSGVIGRYSLDADKQPVVSVSWNEAVRYLNWLSEKEGLEPYYRFEGEKVLVPDFQGLGYRLPSEAEWAYVARQAGRGIRDKYPWGAGYPPYQVAGNYGDVAAGSILGGTLKGYNDSFAVSSPVGSFPPNSAGIYDIGGNVAEWCHDFYAAYNPVSTSNPFGPKTGSLHVIRGSSWRDSTITELRLSYRRYHKKAQDDVGFRAVRYAQ